MNEPEKQPEPQQPAETPAAPPTVATETPAAAPPPPAGDKKKGRPGDKSSTFKSQRVRSGQPIPSLAEMDRFQQGSRLKSLDAEIEEELQAALAGFSEDEMSSQTQQAAPNKQQPAEPGRKKGKIISVHGQDVFVDTGGRTQGILPVLQFPDGPPTPGTEVEFEIERYDNANGLLVLTRRGAAVVANWGSVEIGQTVEARVTEVNKGGLTVDVNGIRGFMPISQIDLFRVEKTDQYVNQKLLCLVTEANAEERNLVVSRRALLEKEREVQREKLWAELAEGQVHTGIVRSVRDFGAFVDLGGVDGLLHVSEMSWRRVKDPTEVVQPGQSLKVIVLKIDHENRKLSLGLKQLEASPWDNIEAKYPIGTIVTGTVTRLMDFGAFAELEPGVEGLIHISEMAQGRVRRVQDIVKPEQPVQVMVLRIDMESRKIGLSLKAALTPEEEPAAEAEVEEEVVEEVKPPRPRTTPLRGGVGAATFTLKVEEPEA